MRITAAVSRSGEAAPVLEPADLDEPRDGEVLVRMRATGICHTDLRAHTGLHYPMPLPAVLGHEGAGVVERVGAGVFGLSPGDHVVLVAASCGCCPSCRSGLPGYCEDFLRQAFQGRRPDGPSPLSQDCEALHGHFLGQSSFATHAVVNARGVVRIASDIPFEIAAPLGCGVLTGAGAVLCSFGLRPGETLAVIGAGAVGLSAVMAAKLCGGVAIAIDPVRARRELALRLGAAEVLNPEDGDLGEALRAFAPDGVTYVLLTAGAQPLFDAAIGALAVRGTAGFVAATPEPLHVSGRTLLWGGRSLRGILLGDANPHLVIPQLLEAWRQGRFPLERLIRIYPFGQVASAFAHSDAGEAIKPVLMFD